MSGPAPADSARAERFQGEGRSVFRCRIDRFDRIVDLAGEDVTDFVETVPAAPNHLIGSSIYDHVSGHFTRRFLRSFIEHARKSGEQPRRLYRCDSPHHRRLMEMRAIPEEDGAVCLEHRLIEESRFDFPIEVRAAPKRGLAYYLRCSNCCRLRPIRHGEWREPEDYARPDHTHQVIHTICPSCQSGQVVRRLILRPAG